MICRECLQLHLSLPALNKSPGKGCCQPSPLVASQRALSPQGRDLTVTWEAALPWPQVSAKISLPLCQLGKGIEEKLVSHRQKWNQLHHCSVGTWRLCVTHLGDLSEVFVATSPYHVPSTLNLHSSHFSICTSSGWESEDRSPMPWFSGESYPFGERGVNEYLETSGHGIFAEGVELGQGEKAPTPPWQRPAASQSLSRVLRGASALSAFIHGMQVFCSLYHG